LVYTGALHVLTPGSPVYALAKVSAIGGLIALRFVMARRQRARCDQEAEAKAPPRPERSPQPHPVSRKKQRRRRR
jgi:hypothetical protein